MEILLLGSGMSFALRGGAGLKVGVRERGRTKKVNFLAVNMIYLGIGWVVDFFREAVKKLFGLSAGGDFSDKLGPLVGVIEN
jgi:hypothetical protein